MNGFVVWFTGLPSAGKSTLAGLLAAALKDRGLRAEVLDGDQVRRTLTKGLGFSREDRDENIRRIAWLAGVLARNGTIAITAAISPYRSARDEARREIGRFVEVHVKCPLEVCMQRDRKGLYARAARGEVPRFTGISDPYEAPLHPELSVDTDRQTPEETLHSILTYLERARWLPHGTEAVHLPSYVVAHLRRAWGDGPLESRVAAVLLQNVAVNEDPVAAEEREAIVGRLRSLGYLE